MTNKEVLLTVKSKLLQAELDFGESLSWSEIFKIVQGVETLVDCEPVPVKKLLFVEDGSVDTDELEVYLPKDTKVIVYRQGSTMPVFKEV